MKKTLLILLTLVFIGSVHEVVAQTAPQTYAASYTGYGPTAIIPITSTGFTDIGSFDFKIEYDETIVEVLTAAWGPLLPVNPAFVDINYSIPGEIYVSWFNIPAVTLDDNTVLLEITFNEVLSGSTLVHFDNTNNNCFYGDANQNPIPDDDSDWNDGSITFWALTVTEWTGANGTDWSLGTNWTAGLPTENNEAFIPNGLTNYPIVTADDAICGVVRISSLANLTIEPGGALTVTNEIIDNGELTIRSSAAGDGSLIDGGVNSGTGTVTVERYLAPDLWHGVSPPITGGLSGIFLDLYLMEWDEPTATWPEIIEIDVELNTMQGYMAWAAGSTGLTAVDYVSSIQNLNTGTYTTGDLTTDGPTGGSIVPGFHLVGNPYPSALDWDATSGWTKFALFEAIYFWDEAIGQYAAYVNGVPTNGGSNIIPSGQGFFINAPYGGVGFPGNLTVTNDARVHDTSPFYKDSKSDIQLIRFSISSDINSYTDETVICFKENATVNFDSEADAYNLTGLEVAPDLYSRSADDSKLSINSYPEMEGNVVVPLSCSVGIDGYYTIEASEILNISETSQIYLEDKFENNMYIDLMDQGSYTFFASSEDDSERFNLHFLLDPVNTIEIEENLDVQVYAVNNTIFLRSQDASILEGNLSVYDVLGRQIVSNKINGAYQYELPLDEQGIFIVTYFDNAEQKEYRQKVYLK